MLTNVKGVLLQFAVLTVVAHLSCLTCFVCVYMLISLQMTCGLKELLLNGQSQEPAVSLFPRLFSCLTVRLGASVGVLTAKSNNKHAASVHVAGWESLFSY